MTPKSNGANSFVIRVKDDQEDYRGGSPAASITPARILSRIRRVLMRFILYFPSRGSSASAFMASKQRNLEKFEPPKTSCSSNYSSYSHYNEAIADCIEFFNKSSQDQIGVDEGRISDANAMVWMWWYNDTHTCMYVHTRSVNSMLNRFDSLILRSQQTSLIGEFDFESAFLQIAVAVSVVWDCNRVSIVAIFSFYFLFHVCRFVVTFRFQFDWKFCGRKEFARSTTTSF